MRHYIGIDLGTTNSAICSFDGTETRIWKALIRRMSRRLRFTSTGEATVFMGEKRWIWQLRMKKRGYTFKRYMGTAHEYQLPDSGITMTPVECSAQILQMLFGCLPDEIRNDPETVTVITVPAAFNQMKKDATQEAARLAGIGRCALMQEPVAAVMSVLKKDETEKTFLIYDLGGGTFDVSVARMIGNHVSLLAQGGKEMCGGRDLDRRIYYERVLPWLREHFSLPSDPDADQKYLDMKRMILFSVEEAKIALTSSEKAEIWTAEEKLRTTDEEGREIWLDMELTREDIRPLIRELAQETVGIAKETLNRAGEAASHINEIVFIGGPTMYAPLRDEVCRLLGIRRGTPVNPMTAVAEGASIYAESIDWDSESHQRKEGFGELDGTRAVRVRYESRCSAPFARVAVVAASGSVLAAEISSREEPGNKAWTSGRVDVIRQGIIEVLYPDPGNILLSFRYGMRTEIPVYLHGK